ncbi:MAG: hypothetical protein NVSMB21_21380 [Vulcanimicrobiaceae bacterium]
MKRFESALAGFVATLAIFVASGFRATPYNNFVLLADAFRHGRVWIDWPGPYIDALAYAGRHYVIEAPMPAILLLPAVALRGTAVSQTALAAILGGVATFAAYDVARRLGVARRASAFLCAFLLLGTDLFWCAIFGDVWFVAHVASVAFVMLALRELVGRRRGWLVAIFVGCAVESRFALVLALPVFAALLWSGTGLATASDASATGAGATARARRLASYALALVPFVVAYVAYNFARWGVPYDIGYTAWYHADAAGSPVGSPFQLRYLGYELQSFFVQFPERRAAYPYLVPSLAGVALTWTSPGLALAFFARGPRRLVGAMWLATALVAAPNFIYYVNGYAQFGMRHALDFEPFLFVLVALAVRRGFAPLGVALCTYSMLVGAWGCWFWRAFVRTS